jgi:hypothetical protein
MKKTFILAIMSMASVINVCADEKEYNDFLTENNFDKCKANITPQDVDELFGYVSSSEQDYTLAYYSKRKDLRTSFAIQIAECQQKSLHHEKYTCDKVMSTLEKLSKLYIFWQTTAQRNATRAIAEYKENATHIAEQTVDIDEKRIISQVARATRMNDNPDLPHYEPRLIQINDNTSFFLDEDALYNQLIACTDESKSRKDCIAGLKDYEKIKKSLNQKRNLVSGGGMLMANFNTLGDHYLKNNVHDIAYEDIK